MASAKLSQLPQILDSTSDDLLLISHTTDEGATYETGAIRVVDFLNDLPQDTDLQAVVALTGVSASATSLGSFLGTTLSNNITIKSALQELESAVETKQDLLTAGNGLSLNTGDIAIELAQSAPGGDLVLVGTANDGTYAPVPGLILETDSYEAGVETTVTSNAYVRADADAGDWVVVIYSDYDSEWRLLRSATNPESWQQGDPTGNPDTVITADSETDASGRSRPSTTESTVSYSAPAASSFLSFVDGKLTAQVLDEDNLYSASADHVPTQASVKNYISNKESAFDARYIHQDGSTAFAADQDMGGNRLTGLGTATVGSDAVTKAYVDSATSGLGAFWQVAEVLSTDPVLLEGEQEIDGVQTDATRVLVVGQGDPRENGLYITAAGPWARAADGDDPAEFKLNKTVAVASGSFNAGSVYAYTGQDDPIIGDDFLPFTQKQSASAVSDGSITDVKLADGSVTDAKIQSVSAAKIAGALLDASVTEQNVTQHQAALQITESQITDLKAYALAADQAATALKADALVLLSGVPSESEDLGVFSGTTISDNTNVKTALQELEGLTENTSAAMQAAQQLLGVPSGSAELGAFNGAIINDATSIKLALQQLETAIETRSSTDLSDTDDLTRAGDNVSDLIGNTAADAEPASWLFLVVDSGDGSIKAIDKTFIEVE